MPESSLTFALEDRSTKLVNRLGDLISAQVLRATPASPVIEQVESPHRGCQMDALAIPASNEETPLSAEFQERVRLSKEACTSGRLSCSLA